VTRKFLQSLIPSGLFLLASCGSTPHTVAEKYYLIVPATKSPYWEQVTAGLNRASRDLNVAVSIIGPDTYDPKTQREDFRRIAATRPAGIMVSAGDPALMAPEIDAAIAKGVPVITVDADSAGSKRLFFVGTNNFEAGQMGARALARHLNSKGNVMAFLTAGQSNLEERLDGYRALLDAHPQIKITEVVDLKGDLKIAFDKAKEALDKAKPPIDAFISMEGQSGKEVAEVLKRRKATKIVIAMDAIEETLDGIEQGFITATVAQKPFTMGYMGLRLLADLNLIKLPTLGLDFAKDPNSPLPRFIDTGAAMVDKSNLAAYRESAKAR